MLLNICCQAFMAHYMGVVTWAWSDGCGQLLISYFGLIFLEINMLFISANPCRGEAEWIQRKIYFGTICF